MGEWFKNLFSVFTPSSTNVGGLTNTAYNGAVSNAVNQAGSSITNTATNILPSSYISDWAKAGTGANSFLGSVSNATNGVSSAPNIGINQTLSPLDQARVDYLTSQAAINNANAQNITASHQFGLKDAFNIGSGLFDAYNKYKNDKMNRKIQQEQLSGMQYDNARKKSENERLDRQRAAITDSWQNGSAVL